MALVSNYIEHFTYLGLFVILILCGMGLPIPEDIVLLAGGYLVHRGVIRYTLTLGVSFIGVVSGDCSLFLLGRHFGQNVLRYLELWKPAARAQIVKLEDFMRRHGHKAILYARFLAGMRALIYISAGMLGVPLSRFLTFDFLGALLSVPIVVSIGYFFGGQIETAVEWLGGVERAVILVTAICFAVYIARLVAAQRQSRAVI